MSPREKGGIYRKVEVAMWGDKRFRSLSGPQPNAQTLWQYLLSGTRTTIFPGLVVTRLAVIADDLRWDMEATRACWQEIEDHGMAVADWDAGVILLTKALFDSEGRVRESAKPGSPNVLKSWLNKWHGIPECSLTDGYLKALGLFAKALDDHSPGRSPYLDIYLEVYPHAQIDASTDQSSTSPLRRRRPARDPDPDPVSVPSPVLSVLGSDQGSGPPPLQATLPLAPVVVPAPLPVELSDGTSAYVGTRGESRPPPQLVVLPDETCTPSSSPMFGAISDVHTRLELFQETEQRLIAARALLAAELGCTNRYVHPDRTAQERFRDRTSKSRDPSGDIEHAIAVAVEEARGTDSLEFLGWCIFEEKSWDRKLRSDPAKTRKKYEQAKQREHVSPSEIAREEQRRLDAEERAQALSGGAN